MKKTVNQTIIVFLVLSLITATQALAQDVIEQENQEVLDTQSKEADIAQKKAEIAAEVAQKEEEITASLQNQLEDTQQQMDTLIGEVGATQKQINFRLPRLPKVPFSHLQQSGGGILVVPTAQMKLEDLAEITEDMSIMSRILYKGLNQAHLTTEKEKWFLGRYPWLAQGGSGKTEAVYLEGFGAMFLIKVNMLLSAPPEEEKEQQTAKEETDPVWSKVRQEMYEPEKAAESRTDDRPEEKYDAEKVESLKTNLIKTLKHATNIRGLQPDQLVILTVIGEVSQPATSLTQTFIYKGSTGSSRIVRTLPEVEKDSLQPSVLTICAKKSDIDAFAKGQIDYDQFRKRIEMFKSYAKAGQQSTPGVEIHQVAHEGTPY